MAKKKATKKKMDTQVLKKPSSKAKVKAKAPKATAKKKPVAKAPKSAPKSKVVAKVPVKVAPVKQKELPAKIEAVKVSAKKLPVKSKRPLYSQDKTSTLVKKGGKEVNELDLKKDLIEEFIEKGKRNAVITYEEVIEFCDKNNLVEQETNELLRTLEKENIELITQEELETSH